MVFGRPNLPHETMSFGAPHIPGRKRGHQPGVPEPERRGSHPLEAMPHIGPTLATGGAPMPRKRGHGLNVPAMASPGLAPNSPPGVAAPGGMPPSIPSGLNSLPVPPSTTNPTGGLKRGGKMARKKRAVGGWTSDPSVLHQAIAPNFGADNPVYLRDAPAIAKPNIPSFNPVNAAMPPMRADNFAPRPVGEATRNYKKPTPKTKKSIEQLIEESAQRGGTSARQAEAAHEAYMSALADNNDDSPSPNRRGGKIKEKRARGGGIEKRGHNKWKVC